MNGAIAIGDGLMVPSPAVRREYLKLPRDLAALTRSFGITLPPQLQRTARRYHLRHRVIQYVHYMMCELAAGRWGAARQVLAEVRQEGNPVLLFFYWLCTANGRWFGTSPFYLEPPSHAAEA